MIMTLFCSGGIAQEIASRPHTGRLRTLVCFDPIGFETQNIFEKRKIKCYQYHQLLEDGKKLHPHPYPCISPTSCANICYSTGTTGRPKAIMISHMNIVSSCANSRASMDRQPLDTDIHISYIPMAHLFERIPQINIMLSGGRIM